MKSQELAEQLDNLQKPKNNNRGVSCIRGLCMYLMQDDLNAAKAVCNNEWDKISSYSDIAQVIVDNGLFVPVKF